MACPGAGRSGTGTSPRLARGPTRVQGARQNAARRCVREAPKFRLPNRLRVADTAAPADRIFIATGWDRRRHRSFGHAAYAPSRRPRDWPPRRQSRRQRQRLQRRAPWADAAQGPSHRHGRSRPRSPHCSSAPPAAPRQGATRQAQAAQEARGLSAAVLPVTGPAGVPAACRAFCQGAAFRELGGRGWPGRCQRAGAAPRRVRRWAGTAGRAGLACGTAGRRGGRSGRSPGSAASRHGW